MVACDDREACCDDNRRMTVYVGDAPELCAIVLHHMQCRMQQCRSSHATVIIKAVRIADDVEVSERASARSTARGSQSRPVICSEMT